MSISHHLISNASKVLALFVIPIGGGIPAGVVLAKARGIQWPLTMLIYFISDLILACVFEPLMYGFIRLAQHSVLLTRWLEAYKMSLAKTGFKYSPSLGAFSLIMIAFGVDPMTGRATSKAVGHGFFSGWTLAICGDMMFFTLIMASTLWLKSVLGNGTWAAVIIMALMIGVPPLFRRWKASRQR